MKYCIFKYIVSLLLITFSLSASSQSMSLLRKIAIDSLNDRFSKPNGSDHTLRLFLEKSSDMKLKIDSEQEFGSLDKQLLSVFEHYEDSLTNKWGYMVTLFWDTLGNRQFSMIHKNSAPAEYGWPNSEISATVKGRTDDFLNSIWHDLKQNQSQLEQEDEKLWDKPFSFVVDTPNILQLLPGHPWNSMLEKPLQYIWLPSIYYGEVPITIVQIRVKKEWIFSDHPDIVPFNDRYDFTKSFALREKFNEQLVGWKPYYYIRPLTRRDILVSAVYNHMSDRLEAMLIHSGDESEATEFIHWIQKQPMPLSQFCLFEDIPELKRTYFYLYESDIIL